MPARSLTVLASLPVLACHRQAPLPEAPGPFTGLDTSTWVTTTGGVEQPLQTLPKRNRRSPERKVRP